MKHNKISYDFNKKIAGINPQTASDSMRQAVGEQMTAMGQNMKKEIESFVTTNKGYLASYFAVTYVLSEPSITILESALTKLKTDAPNSMYTAELENRINSIKPLEIGGQAPEIKLKNPDGELVALSSLRGKVVLIDFWASWCGPCRKENPNVVRMYQKYHDKGFEIYSVSLDNNAQQWQAAIAKDGLVWTHVSDLRGWSSSAAALYKVTSIPRTFLVDKNGRILATDLRGYQLEAKLDEIFN
ncbi:MAG: redoxin domain-containing protein [Bacteroidetes bacterium]|nr:redoxin domain-containing protein [Bacteroidota bacterium]